AKGSRDMEHDREINLLAGENIAMQWVLTQVLSRLSQVHPSFKDAISGGFDDAANGIGELISLSGKTAAPDHVVQAARAVKDWSAATLGVRCQAGASLANLPRRCAVSDHAVDQPDRSVHKDACPKPRHARFAPESGHLQRTNARPLSAKCGQWACVVSAV